MRRSQKPRLEPVGPPDGGHLLSAWMSSSTSSGRGSASRAPSPRQFRPPRRGRNAGHRGRWDGAARSQPEMNPARNTSPAPVVSSTCTRRPACGLPSRPPATGSLRAERARCAPARTAAPSRAAPLPGRADRSARRESLGCNDHVDVLQQIFGTRTQLLDVDNGTHSGVAGGARGDARQRIVVVDQKNAAGRRDDGHILRPTWPGAGRGARSRCARRCAHRRARRVWLVAPEMRRTSEVSTPSRSRLSMPIRAASSSPKVPMYCVFQPSRAQPTAALALWPPGSVARRSIGSCRRAPDGAGPRR